jgi:hypothetical protein
MNLVDTIQLYCIGTATSGCDPAVAEAHGTKCGRPSGKAGVRSKGPKPIVVYHGTSVDAAKEIRTHGLLAARNVDQRGRPKSVYFTNSYKKAHYYADWHGLYKGPDGFFHGDVAIIEIEIPGNMRSQVIEDDQEDWSFRIERDVPPEWIKSIDVITDKGALKRLNAAGDSMRGYVVLVCKRKAVHS